MPSEALCHQLLHLVKGQALAARDLPLGLRYPLLSGRVGEQFQRCLDGLKVLCGQEDDVLAAVAGDVDALMRAVHLIGDLGQPGLDV